MLASGNMEIYQQKKLCLISYRKKKWKMGRYKFKKVSSNTVFILHGSWLYVYMVNLQSKGTSTWTVWRERYNLENQISANQGSDHSTHQQLDWNIDWNYEMYQFRSITPHHYEVYNLFALSLYPVTRAKIKGTKLNWCCSSIFWIFFL